MDAPPMVVLRSLASLVVIGCCTPLSLGSMLRAVQVPHAADALGTNVPAHPVDVEQTVLVPPELEQTHVSRRGLDSSDSEEEGCACNKDIGYSS